MTTHTAQRLQEMATRLDALMRVQESVEDLLFMIEFHQATIQVRSGAMY